MFRVQAVNEFLVFGAQALATLSAGWLLFRFSWEVLLYATVPALVVLSATLLWHKLSLKAARHNAEAGSA